LPAQKGANEDYAVGVRLLARTIEESLRQIVDLLT
jgi:hypothetical protein